MKDNDVASIQEQFGLTKEIVEASELDGTLGQCIKDSMKDKTVYTPETLEAFKRNHAADVTTKYFSDLVDKAKKGDVPTELYAPIKGAAYQQLERDLGKKHSVNEYSDVNDLIDKIIKSSANGDINEELQRTIDELKGANVTLLEEKEGAVKSVRDEYMSKALTRDKGDLLKTIPFDYTGVKSDELSKVKQNTETILQSVFDREHTLTYDDKNRLVVMKGDEVLKNQATFDPLDPKDVFLSLAKEYNIKLASPDNGGQGGNSSEGSNSAFTNADTFTKWCTEKGISPLSAEGLKAWKESGLKE